MAIGDDSIAAGFGFVDDTGNDNARVRWGAREINRTRDFLAQVKNTILAVWPIEKGGTGGTTKVDARNNLGIKSGTGVPSGGDDGDIYFRIIE